MEYASGATAQVGKVYTCHLGLHFAPSVCRFGIARAFAELGVASGFASGAGAMSENQGFSEMRVSSVFHF